MPNRGGFLSALIALCYNTAMTEELRRQLGDFLQTDLIALSEAASKFNVRQDYLIGLASKGKIKAFKVSGEWYAEPKRLAEFLSELHQHLDRELDQHLKLRPSVGVRTKPSRAAFSFNSIWWYLAGEAALVMATIAIVVGLVFSFMPRNYYLLTYCSKYFLTQTFIPATLAVYQKPAALINSAALAKINDEIITKKIELLLKYNFLKRRGRVAGEMERAGL